MTSSAAMAGGELVRVHGIGHGRGRGRARSTEGVDMSQTYLLFQTLLLLFWLHSCMIWTKLTRTDAVFSRATSVVLYCAGFWIFRYTRKIPENQIKNQHSGSFRETKGGPQSSQGAPRRVCGTAQPLV